MRKALRQRIRLYLGISVNTAVGWINGERISILIKRVDTLTKRLDSLDKGEVPPEKWSN